ISQLTYKIGHMAHMKVTMEAIGLGQMLSSLQRYILPKDWNGQLYSLPVSLPIAFHLLKPAALGDGSFLQSCSTSNDMRVLRTMNAGCFMSPLLELETGFLSQRTRLLRRILLRRHLFSFRSQAAGRPKSRSNACLKPQTMPPKKIPNCSR